MITQIYEHPFLVICFLVFCLYILLKLRRSLLGEKDKGGIQIGSSQILGSRDEQEDSYATVVNSNGVLAVLADGMGGYSSGKQASGLVVQTFVDEFETKEIDSIENFFHNTSLLCNKKILSVTKEEKIGSTLAAVRVDKGYLNWISIGDSAIILFREGELSNLNKKHIFQSMLEEQYQSGKISKREVLNNPKKKRLTSYIGYEGLREIEVNKRAFKLLPGDRVILCSDGVYNSMTEVEIEEILAMNLKPEKAAEKITRDIAAKNHHHQDNATIIILDYKSRML
ncbi:MAG TPA: protein phosphatase 2C domain-containing protein [Bacillota bacterium]|nr:protein phosphatase 2C domain-containing protein [Bacillota bacterium]